MLEDKHITRSVRNVSLDAHPIEQAVVVKYQLDASLSNENGGTLAERSKSYQKLIHLKDLSDEVDLASLVSVIMQKTPVIPPRLRPDLEQTLFYLQKRSATLRSRGSVTSLSDSGSNSASSIKANMDKLDDYMEMFYEDVSEKTRASACILELAKNPANLQELTENDTLIGALVRIYREDSKKSYGLATNIVRIFVNFSFYTQFQQVITHHKMGALCMNTVEYELKRAELWKAEALKGDELAKKYQIALRKQPNLLAACITLLTNIAEDLTVEQKMVKRGILQLLFRCLEFNENPSLLLVATQFLLKLSVFVENKKEMEHEGIIHKLISLMLVNDEELKKYLIRLLFNLAFDPKNRKLMVDEGLVNHVAKQIQGDSHALNLLYQLSVDDDAKAMITYTEAIQLLMSDLLSGQASDVTKAVLINACVEMRNAQLVCGSKGEGLDLLLEQVLDNKDLMVAKIVRNIAIHSGSTQKLFLKWMPGLLELMRTDSTSSAEEKAAIGLECAGTAAQITIADWASLSSTQGLVPWMMELLSQSAKELEPIQLQVVIMCGSMAKQLDAARLLVPLLDAFLQLLHTLQEDDEFVLQLLYLFVQLLRHKELSDRLMGPQSALGAYVIDLMHDKNEAIREMCEKALVIMGEHSREWALRIASERFKWHNAQWLEMVESGGIVDETDLLADGPLEEDWEGEVLFDDQLLDDVDDEETEKLFER